MPIDFSGITVNVEYEPSRMVDADSAYLCLRSLGAVVTLTIVEYDDSSASQSGRLYCYYRSPPYLNMAAALVSELAHLEKLIAVYRKTYACNGGFDFSLWLADSAHRSLPIVSGPPELTAEGPTVTTCLHCGERVRADRYSGHVRRSHSGAIVAFRSTRLHGRCLTCGGLALPGGNLCYRCQ